MNPLPPAVIARWSSMWAKGCHPERPWWVRRQPPCEDWYDRCDGAYTTDPAAYDAAHPLPAPPPMPGQVWVLPNGDEVLVGADTGRLVGAYNEPRERATLLGSAGPRFNGEPWPPPGAILVAGPSCYGFNRAWGRG